MVNSLHNTLTSPCGPNSAGVLAGLGGTLYATDFSQNLYRVNPATGAATLIGATAMPAVPFPSHFTSNPDGTANIMSATLFAANGNLYATFDADRVDPGTGQFTPEVPNSLYQINPATAVATRLAVTAETLTAVTQVNGTSYAFALATGQLLTLNLANGATNFVTDVNPTALAPWYVEGATPVPEPVSMPVVGIGIAGVIVCTLRRRAQRLA